MRIGNTEQYGSKSTKLAPEHLEGDVAILTIATVEQTEVEDEAAEGGKRPTILLTFEETGEDRVLWLNRGMIESLVERLGDETDGWTGQKIPVEKYTARYRGKSYDKVGVSPAASWDEIGAEAGVRFKGAPSKAVSSKPATVKSAKKSSRRGR